MKGYFYSKMTAPAMEIQSCSQENGDGKRGFEIKSFDLQVFLVVKGAVMHFLMGEEALDKNGGASTRILLN